MPSHTDPSYTTMRCAVIIFTVVAAVAAEAPYHLPRPAPHAPSFGYPSGPVSPPPRPPPLLPAPFPQLPQPRPAPQAPQPLYNPSQGYNYQQPSFGLALVHPTPQPAPQPIPVYHPPTPIHFPAPQPRPLPIAYPQSIPIPQPTYGLPQQQPQPQPQPQPLPNYFYNIPRAPVVPIAPLSLPTPSQTYSYQQPISQPQIQIQPLAQNSVSSYQADFNQYTAAQAQTHGEALDQTVLNHVQNIIKDNEHSSAKNAGYLSLVSGVSLESAKPSIEISSFVHNSPLNDSGSIDVRSASSATQSSSSAGGVSSSYNAPTSTGSGQSSDSNANFGLLPNNNPGNSYGVPN